MATGRPVAKTLIKFNSNSLEENIKGREGVNWNWVYWAKSWSRNDENAIYFKWIGVQLEEEDEEDLAFANIIQNYKSKLMRNIKKSNWMIVVSFLMKKN